MKKSNLTFAQGFLGIESKIAQEKGNKVMAFDFDNAAEIIKREFKLHPDLIAEAGLQGDWNYTGGTIFKNGKPTNDSYTFLASNWAKPTLILTWDGIEQHEIECSIEENERFNSESKWDKISIEILGINH